MQLLIAILQLLTFFSPEFVVNRTDQMKGTFSNRATLSPLQKY